MSYGIAITTRNRSEWLKLLFNSIKEAPNCKSIVIVNDGLEYDWVPTGENVQYIVNPKNLGIAKSKNIGIKKLLEDNTIEYIFTIEDDIVVENQEIFKKTIDSSLESGLPYFNFPAYSSGAGVPHNRTPIASIVYSHITVDFFPNLSAVFSFFTRDILLKGGLYDEDFYNCLVDGEHIYRYSRMRCFPPFWYFPCISNIDDYISVIDGCEHRRQAASSDAEWTDMVQKSFSIFNEKYNIGVVDIKRVDIHELKERLRFIYDQKN